MSSCSRMIRNRVGDPKYQTNPIKMEKMNPDISVWPSMWLAPHRSFDPRCRLMRMMAPITNVSSKVMVSRMI